MSGIDQPIPAAPGWYRVDETFYPVGRGPFPRWRPNGWAEPVKAEEMKPAIQRSLFE